MTDEPNGKAGPQPVFLERQSYRRRRLLDGARLLPIFGLFLFFIPLLWPTSGPGEDGGTAVRMSTAVIYVFLCWGGLILASAILGFLLRGWGRTEGNDGQEGG